METACELQSEPGGVELLIDKRELQTKARERQLPMTILEKDYVLGWALFGIKSIETLVFKGGTALSKVHLPDIWRLSEDLDYSNMDNDWDVILSMIADGLQIATAKSGIQFDIRNHFSNPSYLQLKIKYEAVIGNNWLKVDVTHEPILNTPKNLPLARTYSDYPRFNVRVQSLEEILSEKLRALVQRGKARDYYDVWRLTGLKINLDEARRLFLEKLRIKSLSWEGIQQILPSDIELTLSPYWKYNLERMIYPVPDLATMIKELRRKLKWL